MISEIRNLKRDPDMHIVIVSSEKDFEKAKQAIRYGVCGYISKPIQRDEAAGIINRIMNEVRVLRSDEARKKQKDTWSTRYLLTQYLLLGEKRYLEQLNDLLQEQNESDPKTIKNIMLMWMDIELWKEKEAEIILTLKSRLGQSMDVLNIGKDYILLVFGRSATSDYRYIAESIRRIMKEVYDCECYIAVSEELTGKQDIYQAFKQTESLMEYKYFSAEKGVFCVNDNTTEKDMERERQECFGKLRESIKQKQILQMWQYYDQLKNLIFKNKSDSSLFIKFIFSELVNEIYKAMGQNGYDKVKGRVEKIYNASNLKDIYAILEEDMALLEESCNSQDEQTRREIAEVQSYIQTHLSEKMSIETLAEHVYLSASYLSFIFKQETGVNLNKYIKKTRLEKAKELLLNSNKKVNQICEEIGFDSVSYFCQNFKQYCGMNPSEYRKQNGKTIVF